MHEMSDLYNIIIFNELDNADEYFKEMNSLMIHKNKAHAYYELMQKCKEINKVDSSGSNALLLTVLKGSYFLFELLITHGADFTLRYENNLTLIHLAVMCGHYNIVKLILDFEAYLVQINDKGNKNDVKSGYEPDKPKIDNSHMLSYSFIEINRFMNTIAKDKANNAPMKDVKKGKFGRSETDECYL
jgi:ankyrin repeat protein